MNAHVTDKLAEHDSAIAKQFADQGKNSASKFNVLKPSLEPALTIYKPPKTKVDILESK